MDIASLISNGHPYVDSLYQDFLRDPESVEQSWRDFFRGHDFALKNGAGVTASPPAPAGQVTDELKVQKLIESYRERGHLKSRLNPIRTRRSPEPGPQLSDFDLSESDFGQKFQCCQTLLGVETLGEALQFLEATYCGPLGFEYAHIANASRRQWLQQEIESSAAGIAFPAEKRKRIFTKLSGATAFETFLGNKYIGQKRFSLEGGENTIPAVDALINQAAEHQVFEVVIGMAHRGRLNILSNIMGKSYEYIFSEFEGMEEARKVTSHGDGDVKYHLGFKTTVQTPEGHSITLKLMPNPSHLEAVAPVVEGYARAKADATMFAGTFGHPQKILPLVIHGDAALAGQGVVYETAQMSKLRGYFTGGTIHFVINNQVGFTTNSDEGRSSLYCTDVAKVTDSP